jgi:hypothetical protein
MLAVYDDHEDWQGSGSELQSSTLVVSRITRKSGRSWLLQNRRIVLVQVLFLSLMIDVRLVRSLSDL